MNSNAISRQAFALSPARISAIPRSWPLILAVLALSLLAIAQILAGLSLRGLYADGAYYAAELWLRQSFVIIEPSRWTAQMLVQAPVFVAMKLGATSPRAVAIALSLSTNLMPLAVTLASLAVLPRAARHWALFPLFVLLGFGMSASVASIADGPTAAAYAWALLLVILFGRDGGWRLAALLVLALGAIRLHEAMAFLGPQIAFAALWQRRRTADRSMRAGLLVTAALVLLGTLLALHDLLDPRVPANRGAFLTDVLGLRWLWAGGALNAMAAMGLLALIALPLAWMRRAAKRWAWTAACAGFGALILSACLLPPSATSSFAARGNACFASAPAMLALLGARAHPLPAPDRRSLIGLTALLGLSVTTADATTTLQWQRYEQAIRTVLGTHRGVIGWEAAESTLPAAGRASFARFAWPWTTPLMSLWLVPGGTVGSIIANPPGTAWQPFAPEALAPLIARDPAPDRSGCLRAALGR